MEQYEILESLAEVDALIVGSHIVYKSGMHGSAYFNKDAIYMHTLLTWRLCAEIARHFLGRGIEVVIGPENGGIILSQWTGQSLNGLQSRRLSEVLSIYAETDGDGFIIKRGYEKVIPGRKVLVVEDVLTTGGSVKAVIKEVRRLGGDIVGAAVLCNRGAITAEDIGGVPELFSLTNVVLEAFPEDDCPLCAKGVPINTSLGKGAQFLAKKQQV